MLDGLIDVLNALTLTPAATYNYTHTHTYTHSQTHFIANKPRRNINSKSTSKYATPRSKRSVQIRT